VPRHDPPVRFRPPPPTWRDNLPFALTALILLPLGLYLIIATIVFKAGSAATVDRLEAVGVPVQAVLSDYDRNRRLSSTVWLQYEYGGQIHRVQVECDVPARCDPERSHTMPIRVDPRQPTSVLTALGEAGDSVRFLDQWVLVCWGCVLVVVGSGAGWLRWVLRRQGRDERRVQRRGAVRLGSRG
jgi:hypothetical protein